MSFVTGIGDWARRSLRFASMALFVTGIVLILVTGVSLVASLNADASDTLPEGRTGEEFSAEIAEIDSVTGFEQAVAEEIELNGLDGLELAVFVDDLMRKKFLHGYAEMSWHDNWVLAIVHRIVPEKEFMGYLDPHDVVRHDYGICNQQAILFQHLMSSLGFSVGSVRFSLPGLGHFASATKIDGEWYLFDSNFEPPYDRRDPAVLANLLKKDQRVISSLYGQEAAVAVHNGDITLSDIDQFPATRGRLVQRMSLALSRFAGLVITGIGYLLVRKTAIKQRHGDVAKEQPEL